MRAMIRKKIRIRRKSLRFLRDRYVESVLCNTERFSQSALEEQGDKLLIKDPAGDAERQNTQIQELIEEDVDAVFLCPVDWKKIEPALDALEEADIPVINLDTKVYESGKVAAFVGSDNRNAGYVCGEDLVERKPDGGQVVIVENLNVNSVCERITGLRAVSKEHLRLLSGFRQE